ncbi:sulfite exporter TauE/SafE family protein [Propionimicrobium sp. PCR01-08-3]|uniref:sulfite exporter TauE/SafE family protein n=1 Tax=Propionimicrobium sp. PCR01-08-3 TaxID=3052086 RepID=UPI00255C5D4A|nr:sulfite exporter TauE/SafE family protein [Propionimicrobium sp. PCR01-08-3]WIY83329.1 sulfite exporter TauE/SafE family protein [Propionimicrobium sp. PCR01-08-3]
MGIFIVAVLLALAGGLIQGVIGFGMGVVASPILALVYPELVPVSVVMAASLMPVVTLIDEGRELDWRALGWIMLGRVPATMLGIYLVLILPVSALQMLIGVVVLVMVLLESVRIAIPRNRGTLFGSGFLAGVTGGSSGIGGPPIAIVLSHDEPARVRATLAAAFLFGSAVSLAGFAASGTLHTNSVVVGAVMAPTAVAGLLIARRLRKHIGRRGFKIGVLALSTISAFTLLVEAIF